MPDPQIADLELALQSTLPMAHIEVCTLPGLPQLQLALINSDFPTGPLPPNVMHDVIATPAYWAFCWGSGLATAQWLAQQPQIVKDKNVVDLGCGSGVVAVMAKLMGASSVWACDTDPNALLATQVNAQLNEVEVILSDHLSQVPNNLDLLFMADVLYDRSNFALLSAAKNKATRMLIADSRVDDVNDPDFAVVHHMQALTFPNLGEFDEFKNVCFFEYKTA
ncbi:MAG: 50S ribosomal protein L11 methyltransferase [Pseudomonadales bacterium]|jgi:predicted nicotinamide N-methyase|nr:50S ribosomal protein L11 methyltransferase [Pseudomonadales bacterium]